MGRDRSCSCSRNARTCRSLQSYQPCPSSVAHTLIRMYEVWTQNLHFERGWLRMLAIPGFHRKKPNRINWFSWDFIEQAPKVHIHFPGIHRTKPGGDIRCPTRCFVGITNVVENASAFDCMFCFQIIIRNSTVTDSFESHVIIMHMHWF